MFVTGATGATSHWTVHRSRCKQGHHYIGRYTEADTKRHSAWVAFAALQMEGNCFSLSAVERRIGAIFFYWDVYNMFLQVRAPTSNIAAGFCIGHTTTQSRSATTQCCCVVLCTEAAGLSSCKSRQVFAQTWGVTCVY